MWCPQLPGFNDALRRIAADHGALLIFDEVLTGFRVGPGGWWGLETWTDGTADLFTFGKVVGGGMPLAALGGRADVMDLLAPLGPVYQAGTLSGNPLATAAGLATLALADDEVYRRVDEAAARLSGAVARSLDAAGVPHRIQHAGSLFSVFWGEAPAAAAVLTYADAQAQDTGRFRAFFHSMLADGVTLPPSAFEAWFLSAAHDDEALDTIEAALPRAAEAAARVTPAAPVTATTSPPTPPAPGSVTLVGGGPGDPGLLTLAGHRALAQADVVLYDHLAPQGSLAATRPQALLLDVGKLPRGRHTPQDEINRLLVEHARAGRNVVRFKGGDVFVFGRGGEEWQACAEAGIEVRVIPGVSSATAGPGLAGIPVTHRGLSQGFTVVSAHVGPDSPASTLDWNALATGTTTLVVLMGVATLPEVCAGLVARGMAADTPAVLVANASLPSMRVVRGTVATLPRLAAEAGVRAPALTVIGPVAGLDLTRETGGAGPGDQADAV